MAHLIRERTIRDTSFSPTLQYTLPKEFNKGAVNAALKACASRQLMIPVPA